MKKISLDKKKLDEKKFALIKSKITNLSPRDMAKAVGAAGYSDFSVCVCGSSYYSDCWC